MFFRCPMLLRAYVSGFRLVGLSMSMISHKAIATVYNFPAAGGGTLAVAPQSLSNGDTLNVDSGTFQTPSSSNLSYTVSSNAATTSGTTITVDSGATISYNGANAGGAAISSVRTDSNTTTTITTNGTVTNGTGLYAIYLRNSSASSNDTYNISNTGSITGGIVSSGVKIVNLNISGTNATVNGL